MSRASETWRISSSMVPQKEEKEKFAERLVGEIMAKHISNLMKTSIHPKSSTNSGKL